MEAKSKFYEFSQNNSGGSFDVDENVCHRLFIEADSEKEAIRKAEDLGCYWDGVENGSDCACCGDRWHTPYGHVDILSMDRKKDGGYPVEKFLTNRAHGVKDFKKDYPGMEWIEEPVKGEKYNSPYISGRVRLRNIEDYAQVMANLYGWTTPDIRIFYKDGTVKEINKITGKKK